MSPSYEAPSGAGVPFGRNEFLRSTKSIQTNPYTLAKATVPNRTFGTTTIPFLKPGTVLAKITSGPDSGKVGPYEGTAGTREVQTLTKAGTVSGGSFKLTYGGYQTAAIAWNATAADVQAALEALTSIGSGNVSVTGGPIASTPFTVTFLFAQTSNLGAMTSDVTLLTGAGAGVTVAEGTAGVAGVADGRQTAANIVGLLLTFLPYQLMDRDVEVSAVYAGTAVQGWCTELDSTGADAVLSNTTADLMRGTKGLDILFN